MIPEHFQFNELVFGVTGTRKGTKMAWRTLALFSGDRRRRDPQKVSGDDGENDKLRTEIFDLTEPNFRLTEQNFCLTHKTGFFGNLTKTATETTFQFSNNLTEASPTH